MDGTVLPPIPELRLLVNKSEIRPDDIVSAWLSQLRARFEDRRYDQLADLFIGDCWWRDILGLAWDFTTKHGWQQIEAYLEGSDTIFTNLEPAAGGLKPFLVEWNGDSWIQSAFLFRTKDGEGHGLVRLINEPDGGWKAWTVFTELTKLHDREHEAAGCQKVQDIAMSRQIPQTNGCKEVASVLIVGADHYPFLKYPENWPEWLGRDHTADFLEHYSQIMGLDVRLNTTVTAVRRVASKYEVRASGPRGEHTFRPDHVVLATGVYSDIPKIPELDGKDKFLGTIYHSIDHKSARAVPDLGDQNVVVIGCSTSGHDIAQDFVNCGARHVSMIQRSPIFSVSRDSWKTTILGLWNTPGLTTEEADLLGNSIPIPIVRTMSIGLTRSMASADKVMLNGLKKAGLAVRTGEDGYGLADHQLITGGHYYIDQGATQMIIDGRIKVHQCEGGVKELGERSVILADGTVLEADVIVMATGWEKNILTVQKLMGDEVAAKLQGFGCLDSEQERNGWWRPTGIPGFWFMTGSFTWCRQFSRALALQIAHAIREQSEDQGLEQ
ncbi:Acetyl-coenzyme A transferase nodX [Purpureocillium lavendulum]|uniref:Acetyl-coenzyme A transferase nodX n=1 Tax=Purpureocillium lavendulum TaxID=1247861 RepID=A0AB34G6V2_9HYPO|nr:Acetyl-coenzyme A transferase nodX [Purpureocillium lavendulum]